MDGWCKDGFRKEGYRIYSSIIRFHVKNDPPNYEEKIMA